MTIDWAIYIIYIYIISDQIISYLPYFQTPGRITIPRIVAPRATQLAVDGSTSVYL